jgi:hypothetical protein
MIRQEKDCNEALKLIEVEIEYDRLSLCLKRFSQAFRVLKAYHDDPFEIEDSTEFGQTFDGALAFLEIPPACNSPFPKWVHARRHKNKIAHHIGPEMFWSLILKETLIQQGFDIKTVYEDQISAISELVLQITQGSQISTEATQLKEYILAAPFTQLPTGILESLDKVLCAVTQGSNRVRRFVEVTQTAIPIEEFMDSPCPIVRAFMTYGIGKKSVKAYKRKLKADSDATTLVSGVRELMHRQNKVMIAAHDNGANLPPKDFKTYMVAIANVLAEFDAHVSDVHRLNLSCRHCCH